MTDYSKSKIYLIRSPSHPELVFVGATVKSLHQEIKEARAKYDLHLKGTSCFQSIFNMIQFEDHYIEIYKYLQKQCKCKEDLERYRMQTINHLSGKDEKQLNAELEKINKIKRSRLKSRKKLRDPKIIIRQIDKFIKKELYKLDCEEIDYFDTVLQFRSLESDLNRRFDCEPILIQ